MRHVADRIHTKSGRVKDGSVARRVSTARSGDLVVTLTPEGIYLREARRRTAFLLPYGVAFQRAAMIAAEATKREKLAARKAKRAARGRA